MYNKMDKNKKPIKKAPNTKNDKKAQINNEIIQRQGKFKQAKIETIRKIVNKLKQSEKKQQQNSAAKKERYQNVLNQLKHMSPKRLAILALIYHKSGKNYLADQNSTVEQLAVGYFTEHKSVIVTLDAIRSKLKLDESSDWKKLVKKLFKKKEKSESVEKTKKKKTPFVESDTTDPSTSEKNKKTKQKSETNPEKSTKSQKKLKKSPGNDTIETTEADESDESSESETEENDAPEAPTTVDDFFITADGKNYLSTAVVTRKQEEDTVDDDTNSKGIEKKPKESSFFHKSDKKPVKLATNRSEGKRKWPIDSEETVTKTKETKIDTQLHPSWQAKQKLKPTITEFKGTKITFD